MTINSLFGVLNSSGVPFLNRQFGSTTLPFSIIGSLGGLFQFAGNSAVLTEFFHQQLTVRYKLYNKSVILIHVTTDPYITSSFIDHALQHINLLIVSQFGLKNIQNCENADTLKSALTVNPTISALLGEFSWVGLTLMSYPVAGFSRDTKPWLGKLNKFLEHLDTQYGCVLHGDKVHVLSPEWLKLPFEECLNLLITCSKETLPPEKKLKKKLVYLPISSPDNQLLLVCNNYPPFRIFSLCDSNMEDSDILSAFNRVFSDKNCSALIKDDDLTDRLKFDPTIVALTAVKHSENIVYVSEFCSEPSNAQKLLSYSVSRGLLELDSDTDEHTEMNSFFSINKSINCHIVATEGILISALLKPTASQILSKSLIAEIRTYFQNQKKRK